MDSAIDGSSATISEVVYFILAPKKKTYTDAPKLVIVVHTNSRMA